MGLRVRDLQVAVPASDLDAAVAWWATALGGTARVVGGSSTPIVGVRSRIGVRVDASTGGSPGYHLDLETDDDLDEQVTRLVGLGATRPGRRPGCGEGARPLADVAGLPFCVTTRGAPPRVSDDRDDLHLRVVMLDVAATLAVEEARFWASALGGEPVPVGAHYPDYTWIRSTEGPGGPLDLCVQATHGAPARVHVDLHCPNVAARDEAVATVTAAGAAIVDRRDHWVVVRAPGGPLACVVPDSP